MLVTAQIALSIALLVFAGLFVQSLRNVSRVESGPAGREPDRLRHQRGLNGYEPEAALRLFARVEEELAALPGVTRVTSSFVPILRGDNCSNDLSVEGFESGPDVDAIASTTQIGPAYFETLDIPLLAGREFTEAGDRAAQRVAIVN